jgi:hypothetical protein
MKYRYAGSLYFGGLTNKAFRDDYRFHDINIVFTTDPTSLMVYGFLIH